jgi:two-component system, OmpR family, sensor histidine kinase KdpD
MIGVGQRRGATSRGQVLTDDADDRRDPERWLRQLASEDRRRTRGRLKIYLGYASGVGKSFRMLDEGRRRRKRGQDVVVGALQQDQPPEVRQIVECLEVIPFECVASGQRMNLEAILRRRPRVCLVDGLAHDNPPGSRHPARWQDVRELLAAGITVIASLNINHLGEVSDQVGAITGKHVTETVPLSFVMEADGIVVVDLPPEALSGRLEKRSAPTAVPEHPPRVPDTSQLSRLRELALLIAAETVDRQLRNYLEEQGITASWSAQERILVCVTPRSNAGVMIETARRASERFHAALFVLYVNQPNLDERDRRSIDEYLNLAEQCGAHVQRADGTDPVRVILDAARAHNVTQIYIGHSLRRSWRDRIFGGPVDRLIASADGIDVRVFPH